MGGPWRASEQYVVLQQLYDLIEIRSSFSRFVRLIQWVRAREQNTRRHRTVEVYPRRLRPHSNQCCQQQTVYAFISNTPQSRALSHRFNLNNLEKDGESSDTRRCILLFFSRSCWIRSLCSALPCLVSAFVLTSSSLLKGPNTASHFSRLWNC